MTKHLRLLFFLAVAVVAMVSTDRAYAQQPAAGGGDHKIAFVDSRYFSEAIAEYKQQLEQLDREFLARREQLAKMKEKLDQDEAILKNAAAELAPAARQRRIEEFEKLDRDYKRQLEDAQDQYAKRGEVLVSPVRDKITKALDAYAQERGVNVIIDIAQALQAGAIAYILPTANVTEDFINTYNKANPPKGAAASGAPPK